jgi:broad specificity phosphatase PhoE
MIITHAGCLRALACRLKIISPEIMFDWKIPYGALFALDIENQTLVPQALEEKPQPIFAR